MKNLLEWDRVLAPGGYMFIILPFLGNWFDKHREPHDFLHIVRDYFDPSEERLIALHFEQLAYASDHAFDGMTRDQREIDAHERKANNDYEFWTDYFHWHIFDFKTIEEMFFCLGYEIVGFEFVHPFHQMALARKRVVGE
jgi:SAM-dependent methyltransferase